MISCDTAKSMLSDYMEHTLSPDDRSSVEEHLAHCYACKQVFDDVAYLTAKLRTLPVVHTSEDFDSQLRLRISNQLEQPGHSTISRKGFTLGLSGAALIAIVTFFILTTNSPNPQPLIQQSSNQVINKANNMGSSIIRNRAMQKNVAVTPVNENDSLHLQPQKVDQSHIKLVDQVKN